MRRLAVFASGTGSNFQAIINAVNCGQLKATIALLVCDKPHAKVIDKAKTAGIPFFAESPKSFTNKQAYELAVLEELKEKCVDFIALAGYMRLIGPTLLADYANRIVNVHPSLLPAFPGLNAIEQALEAQVDTTGVTIHYVDAGMDTGQIIAQQEVVIAEGETAESLAELIHYVEHSLYPETLARLLEEK